jgi:phosphoribosyl 1,2-cyclic phosphodiesterase
MWKAELLKRGRGVQLEFWGTRGSIPRAMMSDEVLTTIERLLADAKAKKLRSIDQIIKHIRSSAARRPLSFGGNTTCVEVTHEGKSAFIDMGSGLREAGTRALAEKRTEFTFFLTHMHWDHVMGLPFFVPVFLRDDKVTIYYVHKNAPEHVRVCFNGSNFPVNWDSLAATIDFRPMELYQPQIVNGMKVTPFRLDHPGECCGFRFDAGGKSFAFCSDGEYKRTTRDELGPDLPYYQNLDLLVFDAQYEKAELSKKAGYGHSTAEVGADLALREGIRNLVFTHHDPWASDEKILRCRAEGLARVKEMLPEYKKQWEKISPKGPRIISAHDGMKLDLTKL